MSFSKPLKTDNIITKAIVPTLTPSIATRVRILTAVCDFFANKYLRAMYNEKFKIQRITLFILLIFRSACWIILVCFHQQACSFGVYLMYIEVIKDEAKWKNQQVVKWQY